MINPASRLNSIELSLIRKMFEVTNPNAINLGIGEPDFNVPENIKEAMQRPYIEFETLEDCLEYAGTKLRIPINKYVKQGTLMNEMLHTKQTTLDMYFKSG